MIDPKWQTKTELDGTLDLVDKVQLSIISRWI
jgi:hypothetical protein